MSLFLRAVSWSLKPFWLWLCLIRSLLGFYSLGWLFDCFGSADYVWTTYGAFSWFWVDSGAFWGVDGCDDWGTWVWNMFFWAAQCTLIDFVDAIYVLVWPRDWPLACSPKFWPSAIFTVLIRGLYPERFPYACCGARSRVDLEFPNCFPPRGGMLLLLLLPACLSLSRSWYHSTASGSGKFIR